MDTTQADSVAIEESGAGGRELSVGGMNSASTPTDMSMALVAATTTTAHSEPSKRSEQDYGDADDGTQENVLNPMMDTQTYVEEANNGSSNSNKQGNSHQNSSNTATTINQQPAEETIASGADGEQYVVVSEKDDVACEHVEVPIDPADGNALGLQTLRAAFPNAIGLKFKNARSGAYRTLLMDHTGTKLIPPQAGGWNNKVFFVIAAAPAAGQQYVVVSEKDDAACDHVEVSLNPAEGNALGLQTLQADFPNAIGLKFKNAMSGAYKSVEKDKTGTKLIPPQGGWDNKVFFVIAAAPTAVQQYVRVSEKDDAACESILVPIDPADGNALRLGTLRVAFPNAIGLKFQGGGAYMILLKDKTGTKLIPPQGGWDNKVFFVIAAAPAAQGGPRLMTEPLFSVPSPRLASSIGHNMLGGGMGGSLAYGLGALHLFPNRKTTIAKMRKIGEEEHQEEEGEQRVRQITLIEKANTNIFPVAKVLRDFSESRILQASELVQALCNYLTSRGKGCLPNVCNEATVDAALIATATMVGFEAVPQHPANRIPLTWKRLLTVYKSESCPDEVREALWQLELDQKKSSPSLLFPNDIPPEHQQPFMAQAEKKLSKKDFADRQGKLDVWIVTPDGEDAIAVKDKEGNELVTNALVQDMQYRGIVKWPKDNMDYRKLRRITFLAISARDSMTKFDYMANIYERVEHVVKGMTTVRWDWKGEIERGYNICRQAS